MHMHIYMKHMHTHIYIYMYICFKLHLIYKNRVKNNKHNNIHLRNNDCKPINDSKIKFLRLFTIP
jgi:hypothetical protein